MDDEVLTTPAEEKARADLTFRIAFLLMSGLMLCGFYFLNRFVLHGFIGFFRDLRVDLPLPTRITLSVFVQNPDMATLILAGMAGVLCYANWRRLMIVFLVGVVAMMALEYASIQLPVMKIQEALQKMENRKE